MENDTKGDFLNLVLSLEEYKSLRAYLKDYSPFTYKVKGNNITYLIPGYLQTTFVEKGGDEAVLIQPKKYTIICCGEKGCSIETNDEKVKNFLTNRILAKR